MYIRDVYGGREIKRWGNLEGQVEVRLVPVKVKVIGDE